MTENLFDWDADREWSPRFVEKLLRAIRTDFRQSHFSIDLAAKMKDRKITRHAIWNVLNDPRTFMGRYRYQSGNRVGLWHPPSKVFVAWKPRQANSPSRIMTVFREGNGVEYMRGFPPFREIRGGKEVDR